MSSYLFFLFFAILSASNTQAETPFSTNDLTILIPLSKTGLPTFKVNAGERKLPLFTAKHFQQVLDGAKAEGTEFIPEMLVTHNWFLTGIRYTPCAFFVGKEKPCEEQIRLVYQYFDHNSIPVSGWSDYVIHVVYILQKSVNAQLTPVLKSFKELKNTFSSSTLNKPLGVHPILRSSRGSEYWEKLSGNVLHPLISKSPSLITFMGFGTGGPGSDHWIFLKGDIKNGEWTINKLPVGSPHTSEQIVLDEDAFELRSNIVLPKKYINFFSYNAAPKDSFTAALTILDQSKINDHNVSCANCHMADRVAYAYFSEDPKNQFMKIAQSMKNSDRVTERLIENKYHEGRKPFEISSFRMFGYRDREPIISQRTVNDAAMASYQANSVISASEKSQCPKMEDRFRLVSCLYSTNRSLRDCLNTSNCL